MAQQTIGLGSAPNDGTGDNIRVAGDKINDNFTELYARGEIFTATVSVSSAQILNSNSSPVQLIASPGAGKFISILSCDVYYDYNSVAYATNINTGLRYGSGTAIVASTQASAIINQTSDRFQKWLQENTLNVGSTSIYENQGIFFTTFAGNPTAGNGTLKFYITYVIIDL